MDVRTVFLYGMLTEDVHMVQPKGFVDPANARRYANFSVQFMD
jgi:hypothetical protein